MKTIVPGVMSHAPGILPRGPHISLQASPTYAPIANEPIIRDPHRGRWEYVRDTRSGERLYLHMDCDSPTDNSGHCIMCGAPCPTLWSF